MLDTDLCLQVAGKPVGYLAGDPVLAVRGLYKYINAYNEEEQGQKEPLQYFFKSPQRQLFKVQN